MSEPDEPREPSTPRLVRPKLRRHGSVDVDLYERMAAAYLSGRRSLRKISIACGVSQETAQKAINTGWPEKRWPSLKERALLHDRQVQAATSAAGSRNQKPSTTTEVMSEAQRFAELKKENLDLARALRMVSGRLVVKISEAVEVATAGRHGRRARVVEETRARKLVKRVVWEDVVLPPRLTDLASALRDLAGIGAVAGAAENNWTRWAPPEGSEGRAGWESLTDEEIRTAAEEGVLPPGVTMEQLRRRA